MTPEVHAVPIAWRVDDAEGHRVGVVDAAFGHTGEVCRFNSDGCLYPTLEAAVKAVALRVAFEAERDKLVWHGDQPAEAAAASPTRRRSSR